MRETIIRPLIHLIHALNGQQLIIKWRHDSLGLIFLFVCAHSFFFPSNNAIHHCHSEHSSSPLLFWPSALSICVPCLLAHGIWFADFVSSHYSLACEQSIGIVVLVATPKVYLIKNVPPVNLYTSVFGMLEINEGAIRHILRKHFTWNIVCSHRSRQSGEGWGNWGAMGSRGIDWVGMW